MNTFITIAGLFVFAMLTTMTILYFKRDAELDRARQELQRTRKERDLLRKKLQVSEETSEAIWSALMAHDDAEEVKFGEF